MRELGLVLTDRVAGQIQHFQEGRLLEHFLNRLHIGDVIVDQIGITQILHRQSLQAERETSRMRNKERETGWAQGRQYLETLETQPAKDQRFRALEERQLHLVSTHAHTHTQRTQETRYHCAKLTTIIGRQRRLILPIDPDQGDNLGSRFVHQA
jgi:hypothetical protein